LSIERSALGVERSGEAGGAVFLSYSSDDAEVARRIRDALRAEGIEVWFDESELAGGDAWDQKIRQQIRDCALFVPIISARTQARKEGYFRIEWRLADERTHAMAEGMPFVLPVVTDGTKERDALVPKSFLTVQWTRLRQANGGQARIASGDSLGAFCQRVKALVGGGAGLQPARAAHVGQAFLLRQGYGGQADLSDHRPVRPARTATRWWLAGAALLVAVGGSALWFSRISPPTPAHDREQAARAAPTPAAQPPLDFAPAVGSATPDAKSIAVLPFVNRSDDREANAFFADGIHEDILTNLALIRELRVVSRTSVMGYRGTTKKIPEIARELGVAYILEGSVRRAGNKVRVTGQLIRAASDEHLWAKPYDRDLTDVFAIQAALAQEIATALKAVLSPPEKSLIARRPTEHTAAYDLYLKARDLRNRAGTTMPRLQRQEALLQAAVELDPQFAAAWSDLAMVHGSAVFLHLDETPGRIARARSAIDRAVSLAPNSPEVLGALGRYYYFVHRDYPRALEQVQKLLTLQPNHSGVYQFIGAIQRRQGHWVEAVANLRQATRYDPANASTAAMLARLLGSGRRYDEALAEMKRLAFQDEHPVVLQFRIAAMVYFARGSVRELKAFAAGLPANVAHSPAGLNVRKKCAALAGDFAGFHLLDGSTTPTDGREEMALLAAFVHAAEGNLPTARSRLGAAPVELRARLQREPSNPALWSELALMEALLGRPEEARRCADTACDLMPESKDALEGAYYGFTRALVAAWTGDKDRACAEMTRLIRVPRGPDASTDFHRQLNIHAMKTAPEFAPLRGDPRFEALVNDPRNNAPLF